MGSDGAFYRFYWLGVFTMNYIIFDEFSSFEEIVILKLTDFFWFGKMILFLLMVRGILTRLSSFIFLLMIPSGSRKNFGFYFSAFHTLMSLRSARGTISGFTFLHCIVDETKGGQRNDSGFYFSTLHTYCITSFHVAPHHLCMYVCISCE